MGDIVGKHDFLRLLLMAGFVVYLMKKLYGATDKLLEGQIGSTEVALHSDEVTFPSVTFCPATDRIPRQTHDEMALGVKNLSKLGDMLVFARQNIRINK